MKNLYNENELVNLKQKMKKYLLLAILFIVLFLISDILCFIFTNRNNLIALEIIAIATSFIFLSIASFILFFFYRNTFLRIKIIKSFSLDNSSDSFYEGELKVVEGKKKYYGYNFIKVEVNNNYFFIEEGIDISNIKRVKVKKGFIVAYE